MSAYIQASGGIIAIVFTVLICANISLSALNVILSKTEALLGKSPSPFHQAVAKAAGIAAKIVRLASANFPVKYLPPAIAQEIQAEAETPPQA